MVAARKSKKIQSPHPAKSSPVWLVEASRKRRQRVLHPVNRDPFFASVSSQRSSQRHKPIQHCQQVAAKHHVLEVKDGDELAEPCTDAVRTEHPDLNNVGGGALDNVLIAQRLPEKLERPVLQEVPSEVIVEADHDSVLTLRKLDMVRRELAQSGERLFFAAKHTRVFVDTDSSSELPKFATICTPSNIPVEHIPSHVLAVYCNNPEVKNRRIVCIPVHATVVAARCCRVPPLPSPRPPSPTFIPLDCHPEHHVRVVPLVPFAIPSAGAFKIILELLCTQDTERLFHTLVPVGPSSGGMWVGDFSRLPEILAEKFTGASLISSAMRVYRVWQNACSLGVLNPAVWQVIDVAWKAHREALLLARR